MRQPVVPGQKVEVELPHSEVCMHMRCAGKRAFVEVSDSRFPSAQIFRKDGTKFSSPVLLGEAGVYQTDDGMYINMPIVEALASEWL
jgi:hypothetical protein